MYRTEIHPLINKITGIYHRVGLWQQGEVATDRELRVKLFYTTSLLAVFLSASIGAITHESRDESIYLAEIAILNFVFSFKLLILMWQQRKVEALLNRICVFTVHDDEDFAIFNQRLSPFIKLGNVLCCSSILCAFCEIAIYPFLGSEKALFMEIAFPLNWKESDIAFWIANIFISLGVMLSLAAVSFGLIILYLLRVCSLRYELLGSDMRKAGQRITGKISDREKQQIYLNDLIASIKDHLDLQEYVEYHGDFVMD